jgi:uncharacterized protein DUF4258
MVEDSNRELQFSAVHRKRTANAHGRAPTSHAHAKEIIIRALDIGRVVFSAHFRQRCLERMFTTVDAERVIRNGRIQSGPVADTGFGTWKYEIIGLCDGGELVIVVALDPSHDYAESPLIVFITGYRKE